MKRVNSSDAESHRILWPCGANLHIATLFSNGMSLQFVMKYRSRTDIVGQMLEAASGGATKTKVMYKAYLSYAQLKEYLAVLTENGLLEYNQADKLYRTTSKGHEFMKIHDEMGSFVSPAQLIKE